MKARYLVIGSVLIAMLVVGVLIYKKFQPTAPAPETVSQEAGFHAKGPAGAPVMIEEFSDFQCPACKRALTTLRDLLSQYPGQIRLVFRHFPLSGHTWAAISHQAAECAGQGGRFWEYHDKLYDNQSLWSTSTNPTEKFLIYARDVGLNLDSFAACLTDKSVTKKIAQDKSEGEARQVRSTPTFFVNGERVVGPVELKARIHSIIGQNATFGLPPKPPESAAS